MADNSTSQSLNRRVMLVSLYGIENRGIRYISAILRRAGFEPHLVLLKRWVNNRIRPPTERETRLLVNLARGVNPMLIGIGFGSPYFKIARGLTDSLRAATAAPVLWGGIHATICPEDCIAHADFVCVGEGEFATLDLCRALADGRDPCGIPGVWSKRGPEILPGSARPLLEDLDSLPFPDYMQPNTTFIEDNRVYQADPIAQTAEYRIYPTRGCPYRCSYCYNSTLRDIYKDSGRYYRIRSVAGVVAELKHAARLLPRTRRVKFDGDVFAFPKQWLREFCEAYARDIGIPFEILTYPGELDEEDLRALKRAGLDKLQTGIQSGSDREVCAVYDRRSTCSDIRELSVAARRAGVETVFDLIFDNPLATRDDKRAMIELLLELERPFKIYMYSLTVFPKTALARDLIERGIITPDDVEGRATKSFTQFRLSFDYPRPPEDVYWISLAILSSKSFVPKRLIRALLNSEHFRKNPGALKLAARLADLAKTAAVALRMLARGELTWFKIRQYGTMGQIISQ